MSRLFLQKLFYKLLCGLSLFTWATFSNANDLGLLESLENISNFEKTNIKKNLLRYNSLKILDINQLSEVKIHPDYLKSLIFHSPKKYLNLIKEKDICSLVTYLDLQLIKSSSLFDSIIINYTNPKNEVKTGSLTLESLIEYLNLNGCEKEKEIRNLYTRENVKRTIKNLNLPVPQTAEDCQTIIQGWKKSPSLPYLCNINKKLKMRRSIRITQFKSGEARRKYEDLLKDADFHNSYLSYFQKGYLSNVCENLENTNRFCSTYISNDLWTKVINGEKPRYLMSYICSQYIKKEVTHIDQLRLCSNKFKEDNEICSISRSFLYPSLYPKAPCDDISNALSSSNLITKYNDCPGLVDNESIVNNYRIIQHFQPSKKNNNASCSYKMNASFANLHLENDNEKGWPLKICFHHKASGETRCKQYIPGQNAKDKNSESSVISKIIYDNFGHKSKAGCRIIEESQYKPNLLEYKSGCFITYNSANCTTLHCPKKIILNQKELEEIKYEGIVTFDYFPTSFSNEIFSLSNLHEKYLKIKSKRINNLTELKYFFSKNKKGLIHGIGCIEDLLPWRFSKKALNQCIPHPFIIDGITKKNDTTFLITRSSIDSIHSPRLIKWNQIFSSISNYQVLHPLKTWGLYGIK